MRNEIIERFSSHQDFGPWVTRAVEEIAQATGFKPDNEVQRRYIYDPDKTWRVRIRGTYEGQDVCLRVENIKLETDEERIREAFRKQTSGSRVRPPHTHRSEQFDVSKGYAYSIDEFVEGNILFDPTGSAGDAVRAFIPFYRELRQAVTEPFWLAPDQDVRAFSTKQLNTWLDLARERNPDDVYGMEPLINRIREQYFADLQDGLLRFMHAHLSGWDVRVNAKGEYVVFANHFWSWRQPAYDVAFPLWGQWLALPKDRRTAESVQEITETWLERITSDLSDLVSVDSLKTMLLNRLFGSLILDIPAMRHRESEESVQALREACIKEAERLLSQA